MFGNLGRTLERRAGRLIFGSRRWVEAQLRELAPEVHSARILEIGSGRQDMGEDAYSFRRLFDDSNEFVRSDVEPDHGHLVVDVTTMEFDAEWDLILCVSVLEHVPDFKAAAQRMHRALRPGGRAVIVAPMCFPYHDEPHDYWRFTVHGVRNMLRDFDSVDVRSRGPRRLPFTTLAVARRATGRPRTPSGPRPSRGAPGGFTAET
jgi:SAM-dependent methyltransferase